MLRMKLAGLVLMLAWAGCATTQFQVPRLKPAEVNLGPVKKVAVSSIAGEGGDDVADSLSQALMQSGRYEVVDRQHLDQIAREQQLAGVDEGSAAKVGKLLGAAALIFGRVSQNKYTEDIKINQMTCYQNNQEYACTQYTRVGAQRLGVNFKVIDATTGKVLATKMIVGNFTSSGETLKADGTAIRDRYKLEQMVPPVENKDELRVTTVGRVVQEFMKAIAPYTVQVDVTLYDLGEFPSTGRGINFAKNGSWPEAVTEFQQAVDAASRNPQIDAKVKARCLFNLGVAFGYSGQYDQGMQQIHVAHRLYPDEEFLGEVTKLQGFKRDDERLKKQQQDAEAAEQAPAAPTTAAVPAAP